MNKLNSSCSRFLVASLVAAFFSGSCLAGGASPSVNVCSKDSKGGGAWLRLTKVDGAHSTVERCSGTPSADGGSCVALGVVDTKTLTAAAKAEWWKGAGLAAGEVVAAGGVIVGAVYSGAWVALAADAAFLPAGINLADDVLFLGVTSASWAGAVAGASAFMTKFDPATDFTVASTLKGVAKGSVSSVNADGCAVTVSAGKFKSLSARLASASSVVLAETSAAAASDSASVKIVEQAAATVADAAQVNALKTSLK